MSELNFVDDVNQDNTIKSSSSPESPTPNKTKKSNNKKTDDKDNKKQADKKKAIDNQDREKPQSIINSENYQSGFADGGGAAYETIYKELNADLGVISFEYDDVHDLKKKEHMDFISTRSNLLEQYNSDVYIKFWFKMMFRIAEEESEERYHIASIPFTNSSSVSSLLFAKISLIAIAKICFLTAQECGIKIHFNKPIKEVTHIEKYTDVFHENKNGIQYVIFKGGLSEKICTSFEELYLDDNNEPDIEKNYLYGSKSPSKTKNKEKNLEKDRKQWYKKMKDSGDIDELKNLFPHFVRRMQRYESDDDSTDTQPVKSMFEFTKKK